MNSLVKRRVGKDLLTFSANWTAAGPVQDLILHEPKTHSVRSLKINKGWQNTWTRQVIRVVFDRMQTNGELVKNRNRRNNCDTTKKINNIEMHASRSSLARFKKKKRNFNLYWQKCDMKWNTLFQFSSSKISNDSKWQLRALRIWLTSTTGRTDFWNILLAEVTKVTILLSCCRSGGRNIN